jgi:hypothetical protein
MLKLKILVILLLGALALTDGGAKKESENDEGEKYKKTFSLNKAKFPFLTMI